MSVLDVAECDIVSATGSLIVAKVFQNQQKGMCFEMCNRQRARWDDERLSLVGQTLKQYL